MSKWSRSNYKSGFLSSPSSPTSFFFLSLSSFSSMPFLLDDFLLAFLHNGFLLPFPFVLVYLLPTGSVNLLTTLLASTTNLRTNLPLPVLTTPLPPIPLVLPPIPALTQADMAPIRLTASPNSNSHASTPVTGCVREWERSSVMLGLSHPPHPRLRPSIIVMEPSHRFLLFRFLIQSACQEQQQTYLWEHHKTQSTPQHQHHQTAV